jgi:hypothetical protein
MLEGLDIFVYIDIYEQGKFCSKKMPLNHIGQQQCIFSLPRLASSDIAFRLHSVSATAFENELARVVRWEPPKRPPNVKA